MTYSRATGSENYRLPSVAGSRVLPVTEKSAVPIPTGKKPASNPGLTTGSSVTENCQFRSVAGNRVQTGAALIIWLQSPPPPKKKKKKVTERHQPTGLTGYRACWLKRKAAEPPLWTRRRQLHMSLSLLRSSGEFMQNCGATRNRLQSIASCIIV